MAGLSVSLDMPTGKFCGDSKPGVARPKRGEGAKGFAENTSLDGGQLRRLQRQSLGG